MNEQDEMLVEKIDLGIWKKILKIILRDKKPLIKMIFAVLAMTTLDILYPLLNKFALDTFFVVGANPTTKDQLLYFGLYGFSAIMTGVCVCLFIRAAATVEESTTHEIRMQAFDNLQKLSFSYFDNTPSGWVMARMTSDARKLSSIISWGLVDILWGICLMIGILGITFVVDWRLALVLLALLPIFYGVAIFFRKKILKEYREVRKINSKITASYNESFMAANTTKTLVLENDNAKEFDSTISYMRKRSMKASLFSSMFWPSILVLGYVGVAIICGIGGKLYFRTTEVTTLVLFINYAINFFDPVMQVSRVLSDFQQAQASAERVISLVETSSDIVDRDDVIEKYGTLYDFKEENWEKISGRIDFNNVSFKYKNTDVYVLKDFDLHMNAGEMVALVGETGSGKSTIANLICRFYEPSDGDILIDGKSYKDRSVSWLHANLGYVLQTPQLFKGTIYDNIRYGKLDATEEEIIAAAKLANAHDFIINLDKGYQTEIGEGGNKLSIGEKQLISFARAVVANPKILILDEATSSIDTENEKIILKAMKTVLKERTSLVVAHRLSTVVNADKIIVLRDGIIVEQGTHKELLENKGYYFELYRNQFIQEFEQKAYQTI